MKMTDWANSAAFAVLPPRARRVLAAIAIGTGESAAVSYGDFMLEHRISRGAISPSLKLLHGLGLIDIEPGKRLVNVYRMSNRWPGTDAAEAAALGTGTGGDGAAAARAEGGEAGEACDAAAAGDRGAAGAPGAVDPAMPWHDDGL